MCFIEILLGTLFLMLLLIFSNDASLPPSWGQTSVVLIPKKDNPNLPSDFRPISLCNVCYKIITKILANRLKSIIHKIVGTEQNGFIPMHGAFDNIIAAQEIAHSIEYEFPGP